MKIATLFLAAMLACVGCNNKQEAAPTPGAQPEKAAEGPKAAAAVAQADPDDDLATSADFDDESEKEITNDTVEAEVDKLAKEIGE